MKAKIKKIHPSWNAMIDDEFKVGDTVVVDKKIVTTKSGRRYYVNDLTSAFGNTCTYSDIFEKV